MVQTYSDGMSIYSVDLMIAYVNIHKPATVKIDPRDYINSVINYKGWGDPSKKIFYSPQDVLDSPKLYNDDHERITTANLKCPIIMTTDNLVIDGVHRLVKAFQAKTHIRAFVFDSALLKKFLIDKTGDYKKVDKLSTSDLIEIYVKRFDKSAKKLKN